MHILAHRGFWQHPKEKNTLKAFQRAFDLGFGIETDVRDYQGRIVVSHDIPAGKLISFSKILELFSKKPDLPLAINIKSDGLQKQLRSLLKSYKIQNYFVFDMSVPDALVYIKAGIKIFTRQSEFEGIPSLYSQAHGVWMDEFRQHWIKISDIRKHLRHGKTVCVVSPDLHGRRHRPAWKEYREFIHKTDTDKFMLCTDYPEEARRFFND